MNSGLNLAATPIYLIFEVLIVAGRSYFGRGVCEIDVQNGIKSVLHKSFPCSLTAFLLTTNAISAIFSRCGRTFPAPPLFYENHTSHALAGHVIMVPALAVV